MASSIYDDSSLDSNSSKEFFDIVSTENSASNRNKDNLSAKDGNSFDFTKKLAHRQVSAYITLLLNVKKFKISFRLFCIFTLY